MKSKNRLYGVEMSYSQLFELLLKTGELKAPPGQDIEHYKRLYKLMDELKPKWELLEELEYREEFESDEEVRSNLVAEIAQIRVHLEPYEKEISKLLRKIEAVKPEDTEKSYS
jgi:hypothetical protein